MNGHCRCRFLPVRLPLDLRKADPLDGMMLAVLLLPTEDEQNVANRTVWVRQELSSHGL